MKCPKCDYERQPTDDAPDWQCPACGVAYAKVLPARDSVATVAAPQAARDEKAVPSMAAKTELDDSALSERHWLAAQGQKMVIYSIVLNFVLRAVDQSVVLPGVVMQGLFVCVAVYTLMGVVKICSGLDKGQNQKIVLMVLSFFPVINLVVLVYLSVRTTRLLRAAGWTVGLLGARP